MIKNERFRPISETSLGLVSIVAKTLRKTSQCEHRVLEVQNGVSPTDVLPWNPCRALRTAHTGSFKSRTKGVLSV